MATLLSQLQSDRSKYQSALVDIMTKKAKEEEGLQELQMATSLLTYLNSKVHALQDACYIAEQSSGKCCILALRPTDTQNIEEAILRVQGSILNVDLPPVRQYNIPRNLNRLTDLKQSVTLTGLGTDQFDAAVHGVQAIYQLFYNHISRSGGRLREWIPGHDHQDLTLTFTNRYLTSSRDAADEVHIADNVVEYWERQGEDSREEYTQIKPGLFRLTNFVEVQVSFMIVRIARQKYVFVPKLRALCLLDCVVELRCHRIQATYCMLGLQPISDPLPRERQLSPLKKVKRKVGYRTSSSDELGNDNTTAQPPTKQLRCLALGESGPEVERADVSMKEVAHMGGATRPAYMRSHVIRQKLIVTLLERNELWLGLAEFSPLGLSIEVHVNFIQGFYLIGLISAIATWVDYTCNRLGVIPVEIALDEEHLPIVHARKETKRVFVWEVLHPNQVKMDGMHLLEMTCVGAMSLGGGWRNESASDKPLVISVIAGAQLAMASEMRDNVRDSSLSGSAEGNVRNIPDFIDEKEIGVSKSLNEMYDKPAAQSLCELLDDNFVDRAVVPMSGYGKHIIFIIPKRKIIACSYNASAADGCSMEYVPHAVGFVRSVSIASVATRGQS
ncbi:hypothetical protein LXA43DRAFT_1057812 [Ganoderma leucocontextum]|nr:hypothetical protein LXA43DRAFT_1057812 [Ganoderma leucocontextum]